MTEPDVATREASKLMGRLKGERGYSYARAGEKKNNGGGGGGGKISAISRRKTRGYKSREGRRLFAARII